VKFGLRWRLATLHLAVPTVLGRYEVVNESYRTRTDTGYRRKR